MLDEGRQDRQVQEKSISFAPSGLGVPSFRKLQQASALDTSSYLTDVSAVLPLKVLQLFLSRYNSIIKENRMALTQFAFCHVCIS